MQQAEPITDATADADAMTSERFAAVIDRIRGSVKQVIDGKSGAIDAALVCLLAEGHLLIEDVPGVGKTMLARALAASVRAEVRRVQFTPDLLPGDVTGVSIFNPGTRTFEFQPGALFSDVVIADEINRASPKTQAALLEAMEERQVSVDGHTHPLPRPFFVVATQNPIEMEGTYALPEAQRDRFLMRLSMGYPDAAAEREMLRQRDTSDPLATVVAVTDAAEIRELTAYARSVHLSEAVEEYVVDLAQATRAHPALRLGASPRATLQLVRAAKVWAAMEGRDFVIPDDASDLLESVFAHRLLPARAALGAEAERIVADALTEIVDRVPVRLAPRD